MFPQEKYVLEERISKPGERDDSLPPDHRFSEADKKVTNIVQYISIPTHSLKQFKQKKSLMFSTGICRSKGQMRQTKGGTEQSYLSNGCHFLY